MSPPQGWQELDFSTSGCGHRGADLCGVVPHERGSLRGDRGRLASAVTNGPLTAEADGGVYAYGSSRLVPDQHL